MGGSVGSSVAAGVAGVAGDSPSTADSAALAPSTTGDGGGEPSAAPPEGTAESGEPFFVKHCGLPAAEATHIYGAVLAACSAKRPATEASDDDEVRLGRAAGNVAFRVSIPGSIPGPSEAPEGLVERFTFTEAGPLGIVFGEDPDDPIVTVITSVREGSMAARLYGDSLGCHCPTQIGRVVKQVNDQDVTKLGFDDTLDLIKGPRPLTLVTVSTRRAHDARGVRPADGDVGGAY